MKSFDWAPNLVANTKSLLRGRPWEPIQRDLKVFKSVWNTGYTTPEKPALDSIHEQRVATAKANAMSNSGASNRRVFRAGSGGGRNSQFYKGI